jgi:PTH1 family peptidyl-tRNA hydrolase
MIVGLGNPGSKYLLTRHNVGFMALDYLAKGIGITDARVEEKCLISQFKWDGNPIIFVKPQTFMNVSGEGVQPLAHFYKVPVEQILVIHDELDLPFGAVRVKQNGGSSGHNGLNSLIEKLGGNAFPRVRIGIGRPVDARMDVAAFVLQKFSAEENQKLPEILNQAADAIEAVVFDGLTKAMNKFNAQ